MASQKFLSLWTNKETEDEGSKFTQLRGGIRTWGTLRTGARALPMLSSSCLHVE